MFVWMYVLCMYLFIRSTSMLQRNVQNEIEKHAAESGIETGDWDYCG